MPSPVFEKKSRVNYFFDRYFILLMVIIFILIVTLVGYFVLRPKYNEVRYGGSSNLSTHQELIKNQENYLSKLKKIKENYSKIRKQDIVKLLDVLPKQKDIASLFVQLEALAKNNGLNLLNIDIAEQDSFTVIGIANENEEKTLAPEIRKLSINISLEGGNYQILKGYLDSIENNIRMLDIVSLNFNAEAAAYDINLITYYLLENEGS